jgi:hypothetical protein
MTNYIVCNKSMNFNYWIDFEKFKLNLNGRILKFKAF